MSKTQDTSNAAGLTAAEVSAGAPTTVAQIAETMDFKKTDESQLGKKLRLRSAVGMLEHPFTLQKFQGDSDKRVEVDAWIALQMTAGKLVEVKDED